MTEPTAADFATTKGPTWEEIVAMAAARVSDQSALIQEMRDVRDRYNGDIVYPWAEAISGGQDMPKLTPHLVGESIDNYGLRAASVMPALACPAVHPNSEKGIGSRDWANVRRRGLAANLTLNKFPLLARRFYRHLSGYATASLYVEPNFRLGYPQIKVANPLNTFPDMRAAEDYENTVDCIYINGHSASQIRKWWPHLAQERGGPIPRSSPAAELWDVIKYVDEDVMVLGLAGKRHSWDTDVMQWGAVRDAQEIQRIENRMMMFPGITMGRVTLDRISSALTHTTGQMDWAARLQLLDVVATEKSIYPDTYVMGENGRTPKIANPDGRWVDGRTGQANLLLDASGVGQLRNTPDPSGKQTIDRMERNSRMSLGLAPQFGGETSNAMRTGRGVETMLGASVDPRVHEMQEIGAAWLPYLFDAVYTCYETFWPDTEFSEHSGYPGDKGHVVFTPGQHFTESHKVAVSYPIAGADLQLTNISLSQMLGTEAISLRTFRDKHPWIDDADAEGRRVLEEKLELLGMQTLSQGAQTGQLTMQDLAEIEKQIRSDDNGIDVFKAVRAATEIAEKRAAKEAAEQAAEQGAVPGGQPPAPAALPPGAEPGVAPGNAIGPPQGVEGLRELQNALAAGGRRVNGMEGP